MKKYLINRILRSIVSIILVVAIVMILIYSLLNRDMIFAQDPMYTKVSNNQQVIYKYRNWKNYGYIDYVPYTDWLQDLCNKGEIDEETRRAASSFGRKEENDSDIVKEYIAKFEAYCAENGYTVQRLNAVTNRNKLAPGGAQQLFAYRDRSLLLRLWNYFTGLIQVDNVHNVDDPEFDGERKLNFTWKDPAYGGEKFSPAVTGNGTTHKYLVYFNNKFPYIHQNLMFLNLGKSYSGNNKDQDVYEIMTTTQGNWVQSVITYPTGLQENSADDLHTAVYVAGSLEGNPVLQARFTDNYTSTQTVKDSFSRIGYSFVIAIISTVLAYMIGLPIGLWMALKKDKLVDKIGTAYIVFITAVPGVGYILMFKAAGAALGLKTTFQMTEANTNMSYWVLPIISLALPWVAGLMRWLRRFMIDQMNADYVKFARSGGLSEGEIFRKHIFKNAMIPIVHGIPGAILGAMAGAFITEKVYTVPGIGGLLINAINQYDNGVIVGVTLFYATITVVSLILGDVLMSQVDPRINFTAKAR